MRPCTLTNVRYHAGNTSPVTRHLHRPRGSIAESANGVAFNLAGKLKGRSANEMHAVHTCITTRVTHLVQHVNLIRLGVAHSEAFHQVPDPTTALAAAEAQCHINARVSSRSAIHSHIHTNTHKHHMHACAARDLRSALAAALVLVERADARDACNNVLLLVKHGDPSSA